MNRIFTLATSALAIMSTASAHAAIVDGLERHYKFDENAGAIEAVDAQGNTSLSQNFDTGATPLPTSGVAGKIGNAWSFDASNGELLDEADGVFGGEAGITFAGWVNPASLEAGNAYTIFSEDSGTVPNKDAFLQLVEGGKVAVTFEMSNPTQDKLITDTAVVSTDEWSHIAFTQVAASGEVKIYVNGALAKAATLTATSVDSVNDLMVGAVEDSDASDPFDGLMDDFGFWSRALEAQEIKGIFDSGNQGLDISEAVVPEPSSLGLLSVGSAALLLRRRSVKS